MKKFAIILGSLSLLTLASALFISIYVFTQICISGVADESSALLPVAVYLIITGSVLSITTKWVYEEYCR